jgi:hypothetical protein
LSLAFDLHTAAVQPTPVKGVIAVSLTSNRHFPRHSHDEFGIGVLTAGSQRSWSGRGMVESVQGDVITVNAGEVHDGIPRHDCARSWRMFYIQDHVIRPLWAEAEVNSFEFQSPSAHDDSGRKLFERAFAMVADTASGLAFETALLDLLLASTATDNFSDVRSA